VKTFIKIAWRNIFRNWRRSFFAILAIATGLGALIFVWAFVDGTNQQEVSTYTSFLSGHIQIHKTGFQRELSVFRALDNPSAILSEIAHQENIEEFSERIEQRVLLSFADKTSGAILMGVDPEKESKITTLWKMMEHGRFLGPADQSGIVVGKDLAERFNLSLGSEVSVLAQAADGSLGAAKFKVIGIYHSGIDTIDRVYVFVTLPAAQDLFALWGRATGIVIKAKKIESVTNLQSSLSKELGQGIEVLDWRKIIPELETSVILHEVEATIILAIVFLIVAIGILNTVLMSVVERVREFGIMMALGTANLQITMLVVMEAFLLGTVGVILGGVGGLIVTSILGKRGIDLTSYMEFLQASPRTPDIIYPILRLDRIILLAGLVLMVTIFASIYPAVKAARYQPVVAIRTGETV